MESVDHKRPHRALLRCKAKMQLLQATDDCFEWTEFNDALLNELATTLFQANRYRALYEQCQTKQDLGNINNELINELVETYQQISARQQTPVVQRLNALL